MKPVNKCISNQKKHRGNMGIGMDKLQYVSYLIAATRFRKISDRIYLDGDKVYRKHNVEFKTTWFSLFFSLATASKPLSVLELSDAIGFTHITVKNIVRELEKEGLVKIVINPVDARSRLISLSEKGSELLQKLIPAWEDLGHSIKIVFDNAHPDFIASIHRIDSILDSKPIEMIGETVQKSDQVTIVDFIPAYKMAYIRMVREWLMLDQRVHLEGDERFSLSNPVESYIQNGGFILFALFDEEPIGCIAIKRLENQGYEISKLSVIKPFQRMGIAQKLIQRTVTRCRENNAKEIWAQTTEKMTEAHALLESMGFEESLETPSSMVLLKRMEHTKLLKL